jgi:hypothetical protein
VNEDNPIALKHAVESQHGGMATLVQSVPVKEIFEGRTAWTGTVAVFNLAGHPAATRAYAWAQDRPDGRQRYEAVLHIGPVTGPVEAVRAAIVAEQKGR